MPSRPVMANSELSPSAVCDTRDKVQVVGKYTCSSDMPGSQITCPATKSTGLSCSDNRA